MTPLIISLSKLKVHEWAYEEQLVANNTLEPQLTRTPLMPKGMIQSYRIHQLEGMIIQVRELVR